MDAERSCRSHWNPAKYNQRMVSRIRNRINLDHVDKICEVLECDISDLIEYVPNQHKITGKDLIVEEHGNRKPKKKQ